jgi:hypothetical protein
MRNGPQLETIGGVATIRSMRLMSQVWSPPVSSDYYHMTARETARTWMAILRDWHPMLLDPAFRHLPTVAYAWDLLPIITRVDTDAR